MKHKAGSGDSYCGVGRPIAPKVTVIGKLPTDGDTDGGQ